MMTGSSQDIIHAHALSPLPLSPFQSYKNAASGNLCKSFEAKKEKENKTDSLTNTEIYRNNHTRPKAENGHR
jgi:hypothetical protein